MYSRLILRDVRAGGLGMLVKYPQVLLTTQPVILALEVTGQHRIIPRAVQPSPQPNLPITIHTTRLPNPAVRSGLETLSLACPLEEMIKSPSNCRRVAQQ